MSSLKSSSSMGDPQGEHQNGRGGEIIKMGYLKKLKTMRKKFFVLRSESTESPARIEYYDNEKKWKSHQSPKRCIALKTCFNINHRLDTKQKYVIALYTKDDCFCLVLESEDELEEWLKALLSLQHGEDVPDGEQPKPIFEHVWQVTVQKKGLGNSRNILGPYHLCLTDKTLTLVKMSQDEKAETFKFSLMSIRRCGHSDCFFYMEVGRSSCTGAGDLWMQTEDTNIAENMHAAILHAMSNSSSKEELAPKPRNRSSSANEASKPISVLHRRQTHAGSAIKPATYSASEETVRTQAHSLKAPVSYCEHITSHMPDSAPHSQVCAASLPGSFHHCHHHYHRAALMHHPPTPTAVRPSQRRHSVSAMSVSTGCGGPTHQRTHSFPLSEPQPLPPWETRRGSTGRVGKRTGTNVHSSTASRERCDSMPSRARTTSEGHHPLPLPHSARNMHLVSGHGGNRPHSMYSRGISYSPPVGSSPVSPASGACSTDSAGSSLSIDDGEGWAEDGMLGLGRYSHSLTPDEPVILEENCDDYVPWTGPADDHKLNNYVPMDRSQASLSLPIQPMVTATSNSTVPIRKFSPNLSSSGFKSGSPSQGSYMDMYSPCGSSPLDTPGYMAMSPGTGHSDVGGRLYNRAATSANHSRTSSLAEETHDGYVPMAPVLTDDGYIDMDPVHPSHREDFHHHHHTDMSPASSCSITSGTPSTDLRFSEYHLEKVSSYFTPSEEDETSSLDRPIRAYSVGSRPEPHNRSNRLEIVNQGDSARVRAFSVGSRAVRLPSRAQDPHPSRLPSVPIQQHSSPGNKSQSAPLLCNSAVGSPNLHHSNHSSTEPMDDLMEMDFSSHRTPRSNKPRTRGDSTPCNHVDMSRTSPYVDMRPGTTGEPYTSPPNSGPYVDMRTGLGGEHTRNFSPSSQTKPISMPAKIGSSSVSPKSYMGVGPYMDMRSGVQGFSVASSPPSRKVSTVVSGMSPRCSSVEAPYVEMRTGNAADVLPPETYTMQPVVSSLASKISGPYVDMKCEPQPYGYPTQSAGPVPGGSPRLLEDAQFAGKPPSCRKPTSPIQEEYMDMSFKKPGSEESTMSARTAPLDTPQPKKPPDGYVEMSWSGGSKPPQTSSLEGFKSAGSLAREDYMNMNYEGRGNGGKKKERRGSKKDKGRYSSQPIAIQSTGIGKDTVSKTTSSSTSPVFSFSNIMASDRKHSTGTSPKIPPGFLPLDGGISSPNSSPYNTLRHNRSTKRNGQHSEASSRRDSCDINSGLNTPTGSTIFPFSLNSPGSPMKPFPGTTSQANRTSVLASAPGMDVPSYESSRKCPVDATSGTVRLSYLYSDLQRGLTSPDSPSGTPDSSSSSEQPTPVNTESLNDISQADESSSRTHDYMNYNPQQALRRDLSSSKKGNDLGDYAIMRPMSVVSAKESLRKISAPLFGTQTKDIKVVGDAENSLHHHVSNLTLSSPSLSLSKPPNSVSSATPGNKTTPPAAQKPCLPSQTQPVISSPLFRPITSLVENSSSVKVVSSTSCTFNKEAASFNRQQSLHGEVTKGKDVFARKEAANVSNSKATYNKQASTILKQLSNSSSSSGEGKRNSVSGDEGLPSGAVSPAMFPRPLGKRSSLAGDEAAYESLSMSGAVSPVTLSRPPSVSSERELHYASLDLAPSGSEGEDGAKSPRGFKTQSSLTESSSTSSPSPNPISQGATGTDTFTYAEIDFAKSEGLRNITSTLNRKVRH